MTTRREAIGLLSSISVGSLIAPARNSLLTAIAAESRKTRAFQSEAPQLAPGAPTSPERLALITAFNEKADGIERKFEARSYKSDFTMPYRLFRPAATGTRPLVLYLCGSGGLGDDNLKQMQFGNVFGTRVWALPENQKRFPCYVLVPQTDRGWVRYGAPAPGDSVSRTLPGLGDGSRVALDLVDALCRELPIDRGRIYVTGQSMGGAGTWHMTAHRPRFFAAAIPLCAPPTAEKATDSIATPVWSFQGEADKTVPVTASRERIAEMRRAGGHPLYTEYPGVGHNVWEWAYTEPALVTWLFSKRRNA
jgi:predicted peptidase